MLPASWDHVFQFFRKRRVMTVLLASLQPSLTHTVRIIRRVSTAQLPSFDPTVTPMCARSAALNDQVHLRGDGDGTTPPYGYKRGRSVGPYLPANGNPHRGDVPRATGAPRLSGEQFVLPSMVRAGRRCSALARVDEAVRGGRGAGGHKPYTLNKKLYCQKNVRCTVRNLLSTAMRYCTQYTF